jgi:hypothetical protein
MSSGWERPSLFAVPLPFGWKLCFSVEAWTICLTVSVLFEALALALAELALELDELELELDELELDELEHPAVAARPAATTVTPSLEAVRRLNVFMIGLVCHPRDARHTTVQRAAKRWLTKEKNHEVHEAFSGRRAGWSVRKDKDLTTTDRRRSADERPTRTMNSPAGRTQEPAASSYRANARAGTVSLTSAAWPGSAVAAAKAARVRTGRPASALTGST